MADEKKYTAREAAIAVLQKAEELIKSSSLMKAEKSKHDRCVEHVKENSPSVQNPHAVCVAEGVKPAKWGKSAATMEKNEAPPGEILPKEHVEGEPVKPGARIEDQKAPQANQKEQAEGNNPQAGAVPGNGVMKLAFFMGHLHNKKKMKKGIALS